METETMHNVFDDRRPFSKSTAPAVKWVKQWIPQEVVSSSAKCFLLKWITEDALKTLIENAKEPEVPEPELEPATEVLFLCSYGGCGKTFIDAGALRKHTNTHGERHYICHYEGCGKKFWDSSKLKRHFLIHTGERYFVCPHEGCGKAFSLAFNLKSHLRTHSEENYHVCPFPDCGKRYAYEYKLKNHILTQHEKSPANTPKCIPPPEKSVKTSKLTPVVHSSTSSDRPFACPYEGCEKAYIHKYKLNLHLRNAHAAEEYVKTSRHSKFDNDFDETSDHDLYLGRQQRNVKNSKQSRAKPSLVLPPSKIPRQKRSSVFPVDFRVLKSQWQMREQMDVEEDSEETEEDKDDAGWRYQGNDDCDEATVYED